MAQLTRHRPQSPLRALLRRLAAQHSARRQVRITRRALSALRHDPHLCKDLGLDPTAMSPRKPDWKTLW